MSPKVGLVLGVQRPFLAQRWDGVGSRAVREEAGPGAGRQAGEALYPEPEPVGARRGVGVAGRGLTPSAAESAPPACRPAPASRRPGYAAAVSAHPINKA